MNDRASQLRRAAADLSAGTRNQLEHGLRYIEDFENRARTDGTPPWHYLALGLQHCLVALYDRAEQKPSDG